MKMNKTYMVNKIDFLKIIIFLVLILSMKYCLNVIAIFDFDFFFNFTGVAGASTGNMNGIGRGKRRFSTDENYNFYDDDAFPSSPTIESISEDLNEMKIKINSRPKDFISKDHLHPRNNRSSRTRTVVNTP